MRLPSPICRTLGIALAVLAAACHSPRRPGPLDPRGVAIVESWRAEIAGRALGRVVLLEIQDPAAPVRLYRVENESGQWLGWVDAQGRVWQRLPFEPDDVFRGVYPMEKGLSLLYEVQVPVRLVQELEGATEASHVKTRDRSR